MALASGPPRLLQGWTKLWQQHEDAWTESDRCNQGRIPDDLTENLAERLGALIGAGLQTVLRPWWPAPVVSECSG